MRTEGYKYRHIAFNGDDDKWKKYGYGYTDGKSM